MNPLYVGIDVSSKNNVIYLMLPNGDKHSSFSLANSHDGSTSVYGDNLVYFLKEIQLSHPSIEKSMS